MTFYQCILLKYYIFLYWCFDLQKGKRDLEAKRLDLDAAKNKLKKAQSKKGNSNVSLFVNIHHMILSYHTLEIILLYVHVATSYTHYFVR